MEPEIVASKEKVIIPFPHETQSRKKLELQINNISQGIKDLLENKDVKFSPELNQLLITTQTVLLSSLGS
jgi:hypothetical protein